MLYSACPFGFCVDKPAFALPVLCINGTDSHKSWVYCLSSSAALHQLRAVMFNRQTDPALRHGFRCWLALPKSNMYHRASWTRLLLLSHMLERRLKTKDPVWRRSCSPVHAG